MSYLLLIVEPPEQRTERGLQAGQLAYERMLQFGTDLEKRGLLLGANSLASPLRGARVQVRNGQKRIVDGPFAEAKEFVGGYFLLNCKTREEAIAIAADCPAAQWCTVEVREIGTCYE